MILFRKVSPEMPYLILVALTLADVHHHGFILSHSCLRHPGEKYVCVGIPGFVGTQA